MKGKAIEWEEERYCFYGRVDKIHLFTYSWDSASPKGEKKDFPYILSTTLPGVGRRRCSTPDACRVVAARELDKLLTRLTEAT